MASGNSRPFINLVLAALGVDGSTIQSDSVAEQRMLYLLKNHDTVTGAAGNQTLTSDATNVSNNDTVTIGTVVYTFKTTLTGAAYEVKIGADAATSLDNIKIAINNSGGTQGTEYGLGTTAHPLVTATTNTDTTQLIVPRYKAITNSIVTTETSSHLSWGAATVTTGLPGYVAPAAADVAAVSGGQPV